MANICTFEIKLKAKKEDCYQIIEHELSGYEFRVISENGTENEYFMHISGECRWSVTESMVNGREGNILLKAAEKNNAEIEAIGYDTSEPDWIEHYYYKGNTVIKEFALPQVVYGDGFDEYELTDADREKYSYREEDDIYILKSEYDEKFEWDEENEEMRFEFSITSEEPQAPESTEDSVEALSFPNSEDLKAEREYVKGIFGRYTDEELLALCAIESFLNYGNESAVINGRPDLDRITDKFMEVAFEDGGLAFTDFAGFYNREDYFDQFKEIVEADIGNMFRNNSNTDSAYKFKMTVDDVYSFPGKGTVVTGNIEHGQISKNENVTIIAGDGTTKSATVIDIEQVSKSDVATAGHYVGLICSGIDKNQMAKGDIIVVQ